MKYDGTVVDGTQVDRCALTDMLSHTHIHTSGVFKISIWQYIDAGLFTIHVSLRRGEYRYFTFIQHSFIIQHSYLFSVTLFFTFLCPTFTFLPTFLPRYANELGGTLSLIVF